MPKGKKKFIDKKNSVTFHLVHRSQQDPLAADESAPQRVLVPVGSTQPAKSEKNPCQLKKQKKEEQQKYGIFFDDDYDYLQHLKDVNSLPVEWSQVEQSNTGKNKSNAPKINLPSSVFASSVEEEVGLLNKAAPIFGPRPDLDPEIVAALDDDFNFEDPDNELEDNFMELANAKTAGDFDELEEDDYDSGSDVSSGHLADSDEERDEVCSLNGPQYTFNDEETKSRFTEYSISSSVMRRNEQLTLLDDKFERLYAAYDENEIGALDSEEIEGYVAPDSEMLMQYAEEFAKQKNEGTDNVIKLMKDRMKIIEREDSSSDEEDLEKLTEGEKEKWDCETILTMNSTLYNHPKYIPEPKRVSKIKINRRTGVPVFDDMSGQLTARNLAEFDRQHAPMDTNGGTMSVATSMKSRLTELSKPRKTETPEERKLHKKELKELRKERRIERKCNTAAFKDEKKRQEKILINNKVNVQGKHIF